MYKRACFLIWIAVGLSLTGRLFSYIHPVYYVMQFKPDNLTNYGLFAAFTNLLKDEFNKKNYILLDGVNPGPYNEEADYILNGVLSFQGDSYQITLRAVNLTNTKDRWEDTVYTVDLRSMEGLRDAAEALAFRTEIFRKGKVPESYRERTDFEKKYGRALSAGFHRIVDHIEILEFLSVPVVYPYGYDLGLPIKFGLDFFEYDYIWTIHPTFFGGGIGAKVFSYKGPAAMSFLPVQIYVPLFVFPDDYEFNRKDLYFTAEAGFFIPQYSYFDLSLKLLFNGISITVGWLYLPAYSSATNVRPEYSTFYGGITFSFGTYAVKWQ